VRKHFQPQDGQEEGPLYLFRGEDDSTVIDGQPNQHILNTSNPSNAPDLVFRLAKSFLESPVLMPGDLIPQEEISRNPNKYIRVRFHYNLGRQGSGKQHANLRLPKAMSLLPKMTFLCVDKGDEHAYQCAAPKGDRFALYLQKAKEYLHDAKRAVYAQLSRFDRPDPDGAIAQRYEFFLRAASVASLGVGAYVLYNQVADPALETSETSSPNPLFTL
jgi:hypothetical protein